MKFQWVRARRFDAVGDFVPEEKAVIGEKAPLVKIAKYAALGIEFPSTVLAGLIIGYYLDSYFNTSPWLLFVGTLLALVGAFVRLVQILRRFSEERKGQ